jgi:hypothetical protein
MAEQGAAWLGCLCTKEDKMAHALRKYSIEIKGTQPLLMHADNIEWSDQMEAWRADPENKKNSKAGDDRSPAWRWLGALYHDEEQIIIPIENVMRSLMEAGAMVPVPGGRSGKTFKSQTQSGIMPTAIGWPITVAGKIVPFAPFKTLIGVADFTAHQAAAKTSGFELFIKRAKIGASKHIRVRPMFSKWAAAGELVVVDDQITTSVLETILIYAGRYKGLGDWRPGGKTPGSFGMFEASVKEI